jgi:hypothetical protein
MKFLEVIPVSSPQQLEQLFWTSRQEGCEDEFRTDLLACYTSAPENPLYAAWYYRLQQPESSAEAAERRPIEWRIAIPIGILTGILLWFLTNERLVYPATLNASEFPIFMTWIGPLLAIGLLVFLTVVPKGGLKRAIISGAAMLVLAAYVAVFSPYNHYYREMMAIHIPVLCAVGIGFTLVGLRSTPRERFAVIVKAIEVVVTAGVYSIAVVIFAAITISLFGVLGVNISNPVSRLLVAFPLGLVPVFALASVYDPYSSPLEQDFKRGLGRMVSTLPRLLLPLTFLVLLIYLGFIPFNFNRPFFDRDALVIYNAMLFAIIALLVGVTPLRAEDLSAQTREWLRAGIIVVSALVLLVSIYALSATIYRTVHDVLTTNRFAIIGWNVINIGLLALLLLRQIRLRAGDWVDALHRTFSLGITFYTIWAFFLLLALPWLFPTSP